MKLRRRVLLALTWPNSQLQHGVLDYARERHWYVQMPNPDDEEMCREWQGDGIICTLDPLKRMPATSALLAKKVPKVECFISELPGSKGSSWVLEDNAMVGRLAAEYYLNKGFRNFLYVARRRQHSWQSSERLESFKAALVAHGFSTEIWFYEEWSRPGRIVEAMANRLGKLPHPLAVFCGLDDFAFMVLNACLRAGIRVPEDVAILGAGNEELQCDWAEIPVSRIRTFTERQGCAAARLLERLLDGQAEPGTVVRIPPVGIVERASTDTLAVHDPAVRKALAFIQTNLYRNFYVSEMLPEVGVSRSALERRFRAAVNRSINEETIRRRIEEAQKRLLVPNARANRIAEELSFSSPYYFHRVFRKLTGLTTRQYIAQMTSHP